MFKITKAASKILKSTSNIKAFTLSSIKVIDKYLNPSKSERFEDASHEFIFKKKLSEFIDFKATNSFSDFGVIKKECPIDWVFARQLIYARFADEIGAPVVEATKVAAVRGISEEFECLRAGGYDFKKVANLIEQRKSAVSNEYALEASSNVSSSSLLERMEKLSIAGYISNYAGDDGLRQGIEEVINTKAYLMQELMLRVSESKAYEFNLDELESVDILGEH